MSGVGRDHYDDDALDWSERPYEYDDDREPDGPFDPCWVCKGSGTVNPLTAPAGFFCVGTTSCPACDGTGEAP